MARFWKRRRKKAKRPRPWPVTAAGLLLLAQGFGFAFLTIYVYPTDLVWQLQHAERFFEQLRIVLPTIVFGMLAFVGILVSVDFLRLLTNSWLIAVSVEGISLLVALIYYFNSKPLFLYPVMVYGIFMVMYLNYNDVQDAFKPMKPTEDEGGAE